ALATTPLSTPAERATAHDSTPANQASKASRTFEMSPSMRAVTKEYAGRAAARERPQVGALIVRVFDHRLHDLRVALDGDDDRSRFDAIGARSDHRQHLTLIGHAEAHGESAVFPQLHRF